MPTDGDKDLVFFGTGLCLRGRGAKSPEQTLASVIGAEASAGDQVDRPLEGGQITPESVAANILKIAHTPSIRQLATGGFARVRRLDRARWLLRRYETTQGGRAQPDTREMWDWLDADWRWAARSSGVRRLLAQGEEVKKNDAETAVGNIQRAIDPELLPLLRLKWLLVGVRDKWDRAALDPFIKYLQGCSLAGDGGPRFSWWYAIFLRVLGHLEVEPSTIVLDNVARLLRKLGDGKSEAWDLTLAFVEVVGRTTFPQIKEDTKASWLKTKLEKAEAAEAAAPPCLPLLELISMLHLVSGARDSKGTSHMAEGCRHMVRALHFDPYNSTARENIDKLQEMAEKLRQQVASIRPGQQLTAEGQTLVNGLEKGMAFIRSFKDSDEGKRIAQRREQSIRPELARRLGLEPTRAADLELAGALPRAILSAQKHLPANKATPEAVHGHVVQHHPGLAALPWDRIEAVLERKLPIDEEVLALVMPRPEPLPVETQIEEVGLPATPLATEPMVVEPIPRRLWSAMWLFSNRDLPWKLVAIAGIVFLLWGSVAEAITQARTNAKNSIYAQLADNVRNNEDGRVLTLAPDFLRRAAPPNEDPRVPQVFEWIQEASYREFCRLVSEGKSAEAKSLLERYHAMPLVAKHGTK